MPRGVYPRRLVPAAETKPPIDPKLTPPPSNENKGGSAVSARTVDLESGGRAVLTLDVDLFELSARDRKWVMALIDHMKGYNDAQYQPVEAARAPNGSLSLGDQTRQLPPPVRTTNG